MDRLRNAFYSTQLPYSSNLFQAMRIQLRLYFQFCVRRNYSGDRLTNLPLNGKVQHKKTIT